MNIEENRLETFNDWPSDAVMNPSRIARAGFFYTKQDITVQCFACNVTISEWSYSDQVMAKHRMLSPNCPFVLDPTTSGNVPNISNAAPQQRPPSVRTEDYQDEEFRLRTFTNWPVTQIVTPESLAKAGFYSLQQQDLTKCAFCKGVVGAWEPGDDPDIEHKRHFPNCTFVLNTINPRIEHVMNTMTRDLHNRHTNLPNINLVREGNLAELGVHAHKGPKKPKYGTLESRLTTFANWPEDLIQTPDILAQAGFYYEGSGDQVRCFHCDGGLKHWDPHDEPWTEHARWFPNCGFVLLLKGQDFIIACAPELDATTTKELHSNKRSVQHRKEITEREIQSHMTLPPALAALNIGLHVGRVKQAIREKLERTGVGFSSGDALIEATLNLQREEEDTDADTQMSRSVTSMLNDVLERSLNEARAEGRKSQQQQHQQLPAGVDNKDAGVEVNAEEQNRGAPQLSLEEENRLLKEARLCKICMDCEVGIVFLPCGHLTTCINCAPNLQDCPVCRSAIKATVRTFLS